VLVLSLFSVVASWFSSKPKSAKELYPLEQNLYTFDKRTPQLLIEGNRMLVQEASMVLQRNKEDMETLIMPIIRYLSEYTMLLTASQSYHHKEAGSLFYHLLETANIAARSATDNPKLLFDVALEHRALYSRIYPLCAWLSGILHDIAKPLTDFQVHVYDANRRPIDIKQLWQPDEETLFTYLLRYKAAYYRVLYLSDKQYTMHEMQQMLFIKRFIEFFPAQSQERLILKKILPLTLDKSSPIYQITKKADMESTRRDTLRLSPYPVLKNLSKAFVDTFQDFDRIYRVSGDTNLPYYFSPIGIHIRYPDGMHSLIQQIHQKFGQYAKKPIPKDPDAWVQLLGTEHHLLVPNHASNIYHNSNFLDIGHFIYMVDVGLPTGNAQERVITLSYESVNLDIDKSSHYYQATFATQQNINPPAIAEPVGELTPKTQKKKPTRKKTPSSKKPAVKDQAEPSLLIVEASPQQPMFTSAQNPIEITDDEQVLAVAPPPQEEIIGSALEGQVLAVAPPPQNIEVSSVPTISHDSLNAMIMQAGETPTELVASDENLLLESSQNGQHQVHGQEKPMLVEPFVSYLPPCKPQKTTSLTIQSMANEIPSDHILMQWGNRIEPFRKAYALQIKLLLLLQDINKHDIQKMLTQNGSYLFTEKGFGVNNGYFEQIVKSFGSNVGWSIALQTAISAQSNKQELIPEIRTAMFSNDVERHLIFTTPLAQHLLHRYRGVLKPKIQLGELVL
jgi:hypothetical protein